MKYFGKQSLTISLAIASVLSAHAMDSPLKVQDGSSLNTAPYAAGIQAFSKQAVEELYHEAILSPSDSFFNPEKVMSEVPKRIYKIRIGNSFPTLSKTQLNTFIDQVLKEEVSGNIEIPSESEGQADYGYSFVGLGHVHLKLLSDISNHFHQSGLRPKVADFGAGHGVMSWKILSLGGDLTAVEKLHSVAKCLPKKTCNAKPFLNDTPLKSICKLYPGDVLNTSSKFYQATYDITWSGNLLHMLTPDQAKNFVRKRFEVTVPGGRAYDIVQTPKEESVINFMLEKRAKGVKFPGYIIVNQRHIGNNTQLPNKGFLNTSNLYQALVPVCLAPEGTVPQLRKEGSFENPGIIQPKMLPNNQFELITSHYAMMYFDEDSLRSLYEEAGFVVEDIFYEYLKVKATDKLQVDMGGVGFMLSIIARKPY